ncbi:APC family permease [Paenarthrobacter sp. NEAU-H11]|uniref:APC family permease n=1 Tax=Paenarthrobacter sp. NEAU-H11 TaxID=3423924 RepID=UPI003D340291
MSNSIDVSRELEVGKLSGVSLASLSLASFFPAVGIALVPLLVLSTAGPTAWQSSLLASIAVVCVGFSVTAFARKYVATGSLYSYVGEVFGPWARYVTGAALLGGFVVAVGALAGVLGIFAGSFLYGRGMTNALEAGPQLAITAIAIAIAFAIAYRGLDTSVKVAVTLALISLPLVIVISVASVLHTGFDLAVQLDFGSASLGGTLHGVALGAAFLVGFESCAALAMEARDPRRSVPLAVMSVPVVLGAIFPIVTLMQVPGLIAAGDSLAAGVSAPAALALQSGLGEGVATASDVVLAVATFAALIGFLNFGARFVKTLAEDGLLPRRIAIVHSRHRSPYVGLILIGLGGAAVIAVLLVLTGDVASAYYTVAPLVVYLWVVPYVLISVGAVRLALRDKQTRIGLITTAVIGGAGMAWAYIDGLINPPPTPADAMSWVVLIVIVVLPLIFIVTARRTSKPGRPLAPEAPEHTAA